MRSGAPGYPVDRYLVESSKTFEMVNITDDEIWNPEPAIRPEDEVILRKLHEMLQSTADDLKLISGELMKYREPKAHLKTLPTPLDEEFNEKVHIEEIVDAKFHGYKFVDLPHKNPQKVVKNNTDSVSAKPITKTINARVQVNKIPTVTKPFSKKTLSMSKTKTVQIDEQPTNNSIAASPNDAIVNNTAAPCVAYMQFSHNYVQPKARVGHRKPLRIQEMPSINIRSELKEQKVLQLDIIPEQIDKTDNFTMRSNVSVIAMQHEPIPKIDEASAANCSQAQRAAAVVTVPPVRKVSNMLTCESTESTNNVTSDARTDSITTPTLIKSTARSTPKSSARFDVRRSKESKLNQNEIDKRSHRNIDEWKKQLNTIYSQPSTSKRSKTHSITFTKELPTKSIPLPARSNPPQNLLNNAEYVPYAKLTLGGARVSDIEREISNIPDKNNIRLSPVLDKILASRESSFRVASPKGKADKKNKNVLTASDENLLEEVLDIEKKVTTTMSRNLKEKDKKSPSRSANSSTENSESDRDSYADDFDEERSDSDEDNSIDNQTGNVQESNVHRRTQTNVQNTTYTKSSNLSFKNSVDTFEFIHSVDTRDNATQSNADRKLSPKATQTSPRNVQPIRNALWPCDDPRAELRRVLNEDRIKKIIVDECKDILEKNSTKPTASEDSGDVKKNYTASQKITQTSPARVRSVMTSPARTRTMATSPPAQPAPPAAVDRRTSPIVFDADDHRSLHIDLDRVDDPAITINLSSTRFNLRLPQHPRDVVSNLDAASSEFDCARNKARAHRPFRTLSSSSRTDAGRSSSDLSSLGEINNKYRRRLKKTKIPTISESSASSIVSKYSSDVSSDVLPLKVTEKLV